MADDVSSFPRAPDDPFARRLGDGAAPSPFRANLGDEPPWLAGREDALTAAAHVMADLLAGVPGRPLGYAGGMGMGKTALLNRIKQEVVGRGGVNVWLEGSTTEHAAITVLQGAAEELDSLSALSGQPHQAGGSEPAGGPSHESRNGAITTVGQAFAQAAAAARAAGRPLVVMIDDYNADSDTTAQLWQAHEAASRGPDRSPQAVIVAGVDPTATAPRSGVLTIELEYLRPDEAFVALKVPLEQHGRAIDDRIVRRAADRTGGHPLHVQAMGEQLWRATNREGDLQPDDIDVLAARSQRHLGSHYAKIWAGLPDKSREYVAAIAHPSGGPVTSLDAARHAGYDTTQAVSPMRATLLNQGTLRAPARGQIEVAIPGLGRWLAQRGDAAWQR